MKCFNCNYESYYNFNFCPKCGANHSHITQNRIYKNVNDNSSKYDLMSILSFIFSIFTVVLCCFNILAIPGLILGIFSYKKTQYKGLSIAAIIISIISICLFMLFLFILIINESGQNSYYYNDTINLLNIL